MLELDATGTMVKVIDWSCDDAATWLNNQGFSEYVDLLCNQHQIDGKALLLLTEDDLKQPPIHIKILGDIKRLYFSISKLQVEQQDVVPNHISNKSYRAASPSGRPLRELSRRTRLDSDLSSVQSDDDRGDSGLSQKRQSKCLKPEYVKLFLSYVYMVTVFLLTAFVMVIVHDRVPDMEKYPPLPDLALDNIPLIPWAFDMCEVTALAMMTILGITLIFHKHRFIIMRRLFALTGTVFMLRCVTMLITSLSVPGQHLQCGPKTNDQLWSKIERTLVIWKGAGMSLQGVRTCGDYMFSGHTIMVTMLNFFITEYTPRKMHMLHTASWVMNIFGIFFILAAHEHYSIDVFVAFYITSRLVLYYHSLANNRALQQPDHRRTRIWFPMFSFFESQISGIIPNEYEWPLPWPKAWIEHFLDKKRDL